MDLKLNLKQELRLVLTQEMQLSLNILEMSSQDLLNFLETEKKSNSGMEIIYPNTSSSKGDNSNFDPFNSFSEEETLVDKLEEQIGYLKLSPILKETTIFIVNNLTHKGYLGIPMDEIKDILNINNKTLLEALDIVNNLEPVGVGAQNLQDSLKIQLKAKGITDNKLFDMINFHLQDLAKNNFSKIATSLDISVEDVKKNLEIIQTLNPIPARGYRMRSSSNYITPDAEIKIENNHLTYKINDSNIPKIYIDSSSNMSKQNHDRINYILKSIEKRFLTLERIIQFLIFAQKDYFFYGKKSLKTLSLKDLARNLELHESTISRAIKNKFLKTPQGIITFKTLFIHDEKIFKIKDIIEEAIEKEEPCSPLSDNALSLILQSKGYKVARRTVTKYREELGFKSTRERKRNN